MAHRTIWQFFLHLIKNTMLKIAMISVVSINYTVSSAQSDSNLYEMTLTVNMKDGVNNFYFSKDGNLFMTGYVCAKPNGNSCSNRNDLYVLSRKNSCIKNVCGSYRLANNNIDIKFFTKNNGQSYSWKLRYNSKVCKFIGFSTNTRGYRYSRKGKSSDVCVVRRGRHL